MRFLFILLMCFSSPLLANTDCPEPNPSPTPVQSPVYPKNHDDTGKAFLITAIVVGVGFWIYCHVTDKCHAQETVTRSDDDLKVTPPESVLSDKKRQFVIEAQ